MIHPVSSGAGPAAAPTRPSPEEVAKRFQSVSKGARAASQIGESRVHISTEGAQRAQAEAQASPQAQQPATRPDAAPSAGAPHREAPASAVQEAQAPAAAILESALDLAFAAADGNRDGTVTISEQQNFEVRTVRINVQQPADGRPGPAGSGPIRAYLDVDATIAGI